MPVERRIRDGAHRNADGLEPDVDRALGAVVRGAHRRVALRRAVTAAVTVPAVALAIVFGPHLLPANGGSGTRIPAGSPTPAPTVVAPVLSGTYTRWLSPNLAVARGNGIAGTWTIDQDAQGRAELVTPAGFSGASAYALPGLRASDLRTNALQDGVCRGLQAGVYRWASVANVLMFTVVEDPCDARVAILASGPWHLRS